MISREVSLEVRCPGPPFFRMSGASSLSFHSAESQIRGSCNRETIRVFIALYHVLPSQGHDLTDTKLARPDHRAVYAGAILVHTNNSLHHFRISLGCVWVKIYHDTSLIPHGNPEGRTAVPFTKHQCPAHPSVFRKRLSAICFDRNVWSKSAKVNVSA